MSIDTPNADASPSTTLHIDAPGYSGPERRHEFRVWREQVDRRLQEGASVMRSLQAAIDDNTALTQKVQADTSELVSLLQSFKGAFSVFDMLGKAARPLGYIAMAVSAVWGLFVAIKGGGSSK